MTPNFGVFKGALNTITQQNWAGDQSERAFADPALAGALDKFSLLKIDLSEDSEQNRAIKAHFNVFGPPTILFFKEGAEIASLRQIGSINSEKLAEILSEI